jgi:hypothetical protein
MATPQIAGNSPEKFSFIGGINSTKKDSAERTPSNTSDKQAVAEGVVSLDEFDVRFKETIAKVYGV